MEYIATRGEDAPRSFREILREGLAPKGGLYMPQSYPQLDLEALRGKSYREVALAVLSLIAPQENLAQIIEKTYTANIFGSDEITPLKWLEKGLALLQLSNGPTLAFKDVPLQFLGNLNEDELEKTDDYLNIVVATSGDTGSAAAEAVRGKKRQRLFVLYPRGRTSEGQRRQMTTIDEPNILALEVDAPFDPLQTMVKNTFNDLWFKEKYKLGAMNSINWARIAAQAVYYVYAYIQATKTNDQQIDVSVPSGNFGNAFSAHVARQMGVPIRYIIVATNENDVFYEFFTTGIYRPRKKEDVVATTSPSMDIALGSNFERLIFDAAEREAVTVESLWEDIAKKGFFDANFLLPALKFGWKSGRATMPEVEATIRRVYEKYGVIVDPHTAVGVCVGEQCRSPYVPLIVAETAQPAKFEDTIKRALNGISPKMPESFRRLKELPEHPHRIKATPEALKQFIHEHT